MRQAGARCERMSKAQPPTEQEGTTARAHGDQQPGLERKTDWQERRGTLHQRRIFGGRKHPVGAQRSDYEEARGEWRESLEGGTVRNGGSGRTRALGLRTRQRVGQPTGGFNY